MIFANVTDISIPQGNVVKIHETNSGRVLWLKKYKEDVYTFTVRVTNTYGYDEHPMTIIVRR